MQNDPSDATGSDSAGLPEERRSTATAHPARILVREWDHPGGTERARRTPAPASQHTATHNDAPLGHPAGSQRTPNRQGASFGTAITVAVHRTLLLALPLNSANSGTTDGHEMEGHPFWTGLEQARWTRWTGL